MVNNPFDKWLASDEGQKCADYPLVGGSEYLRNRLWWAFMAGMRAANETRDKLRAAVGKDGGQ